MRFKFYRWKLAGASAALLVLFVITGCKRTNADLFPASGDVSGWQKTSATHTFAAKDLWQYIDGEADQYIKAGVVTTSTSDYKYQGRVEAVVDIYKMKDTAGAQSIFDASMSRGAKNVQLGDSGMMYEQSVSFRKGHYLVHIVAYEDTPETAGALMSLAHGVEEKL
jgi:Family of unknown function (DUF6599)